MFRFIHSSDLHLGKRFGNFSGDLPSRLREARHAVIGRLAQHAREHGATAILLAGDTFDTETPAPDVRRQALAEMQRHAPIRWVILPGNHDSLQATQLWTTLRAEAPPNVTLAVELKRVRSVRDAAEKEAAALRETVAGLNAAIHARSDEAVEEKWRETAEALSAAAARVAAFEKEVAVLQRLSAALEAARSQARDLYLKPVIAELTPLFGLLFDDVAITFDDKTLLPRSISRNGQEEDVDRLSGGMREQLSVLTRLAFARLLARDGRPAPVILDDALVYSDDDRIERMFDALHRQSRDQQIIVFSCRQRAFQKLGGTVLRMTDWQP